MIKMTDIQMLNKWISNEFPWSCNRFIGALFNHDVAITEFIMKWLMQSVDQLISWIELAIVHANDVVRCAQTSIILAMTKPGRCSLSTETNPHCGRGGFFIVHDHLRRCGDLAVYIFLHLHLFLFLYVQWWRPCWECVDVNSGGARACGDVTRRFALNV